MKRRQNGVWQEFFTTNRRLLLFLGLLLAGTISGVIAFRFMEPMDNGGFPAVIAFTPRDIGYAWISNCLPIWMLLLALFLSGLSVWGFPVAVLMPFFFGLGIGMGEATYLSYGAKGLAFTALLLLPGRLLAATALLPGCAESMRFSLQIGRQVVFRSARSSGVIRDFRLYCIRFLIFFGMAAVAASMEVLLRLLFGGLF